MIASLNQDMNQEKLPIQNKTEDLKFDFPFEEIEFLITKNQLPPSSMQLNYQLNNQDLILVNKVEND